MFRALSVFNRALSIAVESKKVSEEKIPPIFYVYCVGMAALIGKTSYDNHRDSKMLLSYDQAQERRGFSKILAGVKKENVRECYGGSLGGFCDDYIKITNTYSWQKQDPTTREMIIEKDEPPVTRPTTKQKK